MSKTCENCHWWAIEDRGTERALCRRITADPGYSPQPHHSCPAWTARPGEEPAPNGWLPGKDAPKDGGLIDGNWGNPPFRRIGRWVCENNGWFDEKGDLIARFDPYDFIFIPPLPKKGK